MPEPSPTLIDTVARAIADSDEHPGFWQQTLDELEDDPEDECCIDDLDKYRELARAALASMPQPVGYGVKTGNAGWYGPHQSLRHAQKVAGFYGGNATVVALVPAEGQ